MLRAVAVLLAALCFHAAVPVSGGRAGGAAHVGGGDPGGAGSDPRGFGSSCRRG